MPQAAVHSLRYDWNNQEAAAAVPVAQNWDDPEIIELAAQALFRKVFARCERLGWTDCDETTREGFRVEAATVIKAVWPFLVPGASKSRAPCS